MPSSMLTFRYRIKDSTSGKQLVRLGYACNYVWNYLNEVSFLAWRRDKRFLSAFDLINLTAGAAHDLGLHSETVSAICQEYAKSRRQAKKIKLHWRSRKRSLGWVPFKTRFLKIAGDSIRYLGRRFRFWLSRPIIGALKTGSFTQDACGHWYVNFQCEVDAPGVPMGDTEIGIDLGLKNQVACSDMEEPHSRENLTRKHEAALGIAQRAHKKKRVKAIHAHIANTRKDWAHKTTTAIANRANLIVVGNVSSTKLSKTRMAKSVHDAGWGQLRTLLEYKANRLGVVYGEVNEAWSSSTCADCLQRTGPRGLGALGVRVWSCVACGILHDRDHNAARNILRLGRETLSGIPLLQ